MEYPLLQVVKRTKTQYKNPNMENFVLCKNVPFISTIKSC